MNRKEPYSKPMRKESKKQGKRRRIIKKKFEKVLEIQRKYTFGQDVCLGKWTGWAKNKGNYHPPGLVPDHVLTRNGEKADRHGNLQGLCHFCNTLKGSERIDFRPEGMKKELEELDRREEIGIDS